jgi:diguanylate cyclase (GGDEF)-like protein
MDSESGGTSAVVDRRVRQKVCVALAVSAVIPLLILTYALYVHVLPLLDPARHAADIVSVQALLVFTALLITAGSFIIWDLAKAVSHITEIDRSATRLEGAYKDLEVTNRRLQEFSYRDEVTGLYNRRFFSLRLAEEVSRYRRFNHPVSVALLDLDGFKTVNDALGHAEGDETLRIVATLLVQYSRGINVICRYGGDEFAVLLVETGPIGAQSYAERIRHALGSHPFINGQRLTASFGVATVPDDVTEGPEALMRAADEALYAAKRAGKNRVCLYEDVAQAIPSGDRRVV